MLLAQTLVLHSLGPSWRFVDDADNQEFHQILGWWFGPTPTALSLANLIRTLPPGTYDDLSVYVGLQGGLFLDGLGDIGLPGTPGKPTQAAMQSPGKQAAEQEMSTSRDSTSASASASGIGSVTTKLSAWLPSNMWSAKSSDSCSLAPHETIDVSTSQIFPASPDLPGADSEAMGLTTSSMLASGRMTSSHCSLPPGASKTPESNKMPPSDPIQGWSIPSDVPAGIPLPLPSARGPVDASGVAAGDGVPLADCASSSMDHVPDHPELSTCSQNPGLFPGIEPLDAGAASLMPPPTLYPCCFLWGHQLCNWHGAQPCGWSAGTAPGNSTPVLFVVELPVALT
eukprot:gene2514-3258_t